MTDKTTLTSYNKGTVLPHLAQFKTSKIISESFYQEIGLV